MIAGPKVPALASARIAYRDGVPVATRVAGVVNLLVPMDAAEEWQARTALAGRTTHATTDLEMAD